MTQTNSPSKRDLVQVLNFIKSYIAQKLSPLATLNSPVLTGTPRTPTAPTATSTTQIASTQFVQQEIDRRADKFTFTVGTGNFVHTTVESITSIL